MVTPLFFSLHDLQQGKIHGIRDRRYNTTIFFLFSFHNMSKLKFSQDNPPISKWDFFHRQNTFSLLIEWGILEFFRNMLYFVTFCKLTFFRREGTTFVQLLYVRHWTFCQHFMLIVKFKCPQGALNTPQKMAFFCVKRQIV